MPNPNRQARYPRDLVKLLNENIDLDALVFDTDASGNPIVVDSKSGDTIAFYDRDTGEWNLSDINIQSLDADSVNTDDATVNNAPSGDNDALRWQEGVESGVAQSDGLDYSSGNNGWGDGSGNSVRVSFNSAFNNTPEVTTAEDGNISEISATQFKTAIQNTSTTGFSLVFIQMSADDNSTVTDAYGANWIATEGR